MMGGKFCASRAEKKSHRTSALSGCFTEAEGWYADELGKK
ncbi:hypothetical protein VFA_004373 [Vibrio furnissii CIP 102972]|nr:hypothetical protein VFA_004373 [Vibrio furnissii CIP 102972]